MTHARPDAFAFGDSAPLSNELADLVSIGRKRATTSLPVSAKLGCDFDENARVICQRFRLVWRG